MRIVTQVSGKAKLTWAQTSADTAAGLTAANIVNDGGSAALGAIITVEDNDIRYTLDGENSPNTSGFGHVLASGAAIILDSPNLVKNFEFVSKTASSAGVLHITSLFLQL